MFVFLLAPGDRNYSTGPLVTGWNSLSIPLTSYPGALNDIYGFKIEQNVAPSTTQIYLDNIYFSNDLVTYYRDFDGDGFGDLATTVSATSAPVGYVTNSTDCNDADDTVWRTGNFYIDIDGDGYNLDTPLVSLCYGDTFNPFYSLTSLGVDCNDDAYSLTNSCSSIVNLKLFIEGYMDGTTMRSVNNSQGGTMASTDVETVTVELHDATTLAVVHTTTGMLHTDGTLQAVYTAAPSGSFYISVKGANFIRTWTATAQTVGTTALTYDFSNAASKAAGNNMKDIGGIFTFYSGDLDADGFIDLPDYGLWENDYTAGAVGAFASDLDGDGFVDLPDYGVWENNYTAGITEVQPTP